MSSILTIFWIDTMPIMNKYQSGFAINNDLFIHINFYRQQIRLDTQYLATAIFFSPICCAIPICPWQFWWYEVVFSWLSCFFHLTYEREKRGKFGQSTGQKFYSAFPTDPEWIGIGASTNQKEVGGWSSKWRNWKRRLLPLESVRVDSCLWYPRARIWRSRRALTGPLFLLAIWTFFKTNKIKPEYDCHIQITLY